MIRVTLQSIALLVAVFAGAAGIRGAQSAWVGAAKTADHSTSDRSDWIGRLDRVPRVDLKAMRGHGAVAVRQGHNLYIADGDARPDGTFRRIENNAVVRAMAWSHDGRFLAFASDDALWIAPRDAVEAKRIGLPANSGFTFSWSPRADVLALNVSPSLGDPPDHAKLHEPNSSPRRIVTECSTALVRPDGSAASLRIDACPEQLRWSFDGRSVVQYAFTAIEPYAKWMNSRDAVYTAKPGRGDTLRARSVAGGQIALGALIPSHDALLLWSGAQRSASDAADGQSLILVTSGSGPQLIGFGLEHASWHSFSDDGSRFVFVAGRAREAWFGKSLVLCALSGRCRTLTHAAGTIGLEPRWRPRSHATIAFVRANDIGSEGGYSGFFTKWLPARTLWLQDVDTGNARPLSAFGSGIFCPRWSSDGKELSAYRNGTMLLGPPDGLKATPVVSGLPRPDTFEDVFMGDHGAFDDCPVEWTG